MAIGSSVIGTIELMRRQEERIFAEGIQMLTEKSTTVAPCEEACPAGVDVPRYIRCIKKRDFDQALAVNREKIPFPSVCAYICTAPCEDECHANVFGKPIAIRALKRLAVEKGRAHSPEARVKSTGKKVAIVGSGPAGLTAAYFLVRQSHGVTVFEILAVPGGMMRIGIPDYRLPKRILDKEIEAIKAAGVDIKTSTRISSLDELFGQGYDAVFLATGTHKGMRLDVPGEDGPGVIDCLSMLRRVNLGEKVPLADNVLVIGGGNVAVEGARTALRLGAKKVSLVCLECRDKMPAHDEQIKQAMEEGVDVLPSRQCLRVLREKEAITGVECIELRAMRFEEGNIIVDPIPGSEHILSANMLVIAIGQNPDLSTISGIPHEDIGTWGRIVANPYTMATRRAGLYAGGDVVTGTDSVIQAIAAGRRASASIDKYLGGAGDIAEKLVTPGEEVEFCIPKLTLDRVSIPTLPPEKRIKNFAVVEDTLADEVGVTECTRCLRCDAPVDIDPLVCIGCGICETICSGDVIRMNSETNKAFPKYPQHCWTCYNCELCCPVGAVTVSPIIKQKPLVWKAGRKRGGQ